MSTKPPYRVPSMAEIRALPWNGLTVASTFAGTGGSSTGYRMAGYRVLYANEFVDAARESYAANKADYTVLDGRDIRTVQAGDILDACKLREGELDVFDGSPPCSAFSTAGKREVGWGKAKSYSGDKHQVVDDLFFEYARLIRGIRPRVFVAENVSGLVKGTAKGYFLEILRALKACGYRVEAKLLDAQWLGVPQARQRLMRDAAIPSPTIGASPQTGNGRFPGSRVEAFVVEPESDMTRYAVGAEWAKLKPGAQSDKYFSLVRPHPDAPCPTVTATAGTASLAGVSHPTECRKFSIAELKRICGFPDDFVLKGTYQQQWERCGRAVPPVMMSHIAAAVRDRVLQKKPGT